MNSDAYYTLINQTVGDQLEEEAWAMRLGFATTDEYWTETREAFEESVREYTMADEAADEGTWD